MAKKIFELFGYSPNDTSAIAATARKDQTCPSIGGLCSKEIGSARNRIRSGVCAIKDKDGAPVVICPIRLYADNYALLATVAKIAFKIDDVELVDGKQIANHPVNKNANLVAVFGKG